MKYNRHHALIFISLIILTAIVLACWSIGHPGLYYDETLFVNAAIGGKTNIFINRRILGIPVLLMQYLGALKAWLYYPLFVLFPVNYWTVRLPAILIGIAGGSALVAALWKGFGPRAALVGAVLILLDPTLITHSRLDWGPNANMFFFRGLLVFAVVSWVRTTDPKWAFLALAAGALGIFDKLNFIWIAGAAGAALMLVYSRELMTFARSRLRYFYAVAGLAVLGLGIALVRAVRIAEPVQIDWPHRISYAFAMLRLTFCGGGALDFVSGDGLRLERWTWPGYLLVIALGCLGWRSLSRNEADRRLFLWGLVFLVLLGMAFIVTKSATGSHHSSVLSGIWQFVLAPLVAALWNDRQERIRRILTIAAAGAIIVVLAGNLMANVVCIRAFAMPINSNWDPANAVAASFPRQHTDAYIISTDWGIGTQLIALNRDHPGIEDKWPWFVRQDSAESIIRTLKRDRDTYIYTRLPEFENFKGNRAHLQSALESNHINYEVVRTFSNWKGTPMIEIWRIRSEGK